MKFKLVEKQIEYNANPKDKNEGDCTIRALSLAYDLKYDNVKGELNKLASKEHAEFNRSDIVNQFIENHGFTKHIGNDDSDSHSNFSTVGNFANSHKRGTYIIHCSNRTKQDTSNSFHLVCVINGDIYDTWDSSDYYVMEVFEVSRRTHRNYKFSIDAYQDFIVKTISTIFQVNIDSITLRASNNTTCRVEVNSDNNQSVRFTLRIHDRDIQKDPKDIQKELQKQIERQLIKENH